MPLTPRQWISADRLLVLAAVALALIPSWVPLTGMPSATAYRGPATFASMFALLATLGGVRGSAIGFSLLWGAIGMMTGLGLLAIFGVGVFYLSAALVLAIVISRVPNRTSGSRVALPFLCVELVGFLVMLAPFFVP